MPLHVDLFENDWLAGEQRRGARVEVVDGELVLRSNELQRWARILELPSPPPRHVTDEVLGYISKGLQGDYVFATEPHDAYDCPYPDVISIQKPGAVAPVIRRAATV
jgi:hypothetical protein